MIDVIEGTTVNLKIAGNRVAFSIYGNVNSLNGDGKSFCYMFLSLGLMIVAFPTHGRKIERDEAPKRQKVLAPPPLKPYWLIEISQ